MKLILILLAFIATHVFANTHTLVVGSTFDYPPLSYIEDGKYLGHDIKIMQDFAKDNRLALLWVKTSWPNLNDDLLLNKFIVAAGGISDNSNRKKLFLISDPIFTTRKAALIRCKDIDKFRTLADIDALQVKVVENKGGTNLQFALEKLKKAKIIITVNNQLPFEYLLQGTADVMFTDDIEIIYKHHKNKLLCMARLNEQFPVTNKVLLFKKDVTGKKLQLMFNSWWQNNKANYSY